MILNFQVSLKAPVFDKKSFDQFLEMSKSNNKFYPILFVQSQESENPDLIKQDELPLPIIENSFNFCNKYGVFIYPSYIVINSDGKTLGVYRNLDNLSKALREL